MKKHLKSGLPPWHFPKIGLKMKLTTLLLIVSLFQVQANSYAQKTKLSLDLENVRIGQIFQEIEQISEFRFLFETGQVDLDRKTTLKVSKKRIADVLNLLFDNTAIAYKIRGRQVILTKKGLGVLLPKGDVLKTVSDDEPLPQQQISGMVSDAEGVPLPGANIVEKGTTNGTQTDFEGNFSITISDTNAVLVVSYIGFSTQEVSLNGQTEIDIALQEDSGSLDEVVVIGYGSVKKSDLTGSVASVTAKEVKTLPVQSLDAALQGRAPGLQVTNASSEPGGGVSIRIRGGNSLTGSNEPLYVIDGFPIISDNSLANQGGTGRNFDQPSNALSSINPGDIESIEILKDASATAIYGSRGANGVIIVTTKRGKTGKPVVQVDSYAGIQSAANVVEFLNAEEYLAMANEGLANSPRSNEVPITNDQINQFLATGLDNDWQDEIFRDAVIQNHQVTVSGGNETTKYAFSGNFFGQEGIVLGSDFERVSLRSNLDKKLGGRVDLTSSIFVSRTTNDRVPIGNSDGAAIGITESAWRQIPLTRIRDENGFFTINARDDLAALEDELFGGKIWANRLTSGGNPVALGERLVDETTTNRILASLGLKVNLAKGLDFNTTFSADLSDLKRQIFWPNDLQYRIGVGGEARVNSTNYIAWANENYLNYSFNIGDNHRFDVLAGFSQQGQTTEFTGILTQNFNTNALGENGLGVGSVVSNPQSNKQKWLLNSWYGRVNYSLFDRYLFTLTARADGSSKFGDDNKWGFFPSAALAWRISEESFFEPLTDFISNFKLRTSYGLTGNQEIGVQQSRALLGTNSYSLGGINIVGVAEFQKSNPDLQWETTAQFDVGADLEFMKGRFGLTVDYYRKETKDLLVNVPIALSNGNVRSVLQNTGSVENKGMEFSAYARILTGDFKWSVNGNLSFNRNEVIDPGPGGAFNSARISAGRRIDGTRVEAGAPIGSFWGWDMEGIWQIGDDIANSPQPDAQPGDIRIRDVDGDGDIDSDDRTIIGDPQPDFIYGFTSNFEYKGFEFSFFLQGVQGGDVLNGNLILFGSNNWLTNQWKSTYDSRWTPENPSNTTPRANRFSNTFASNSRIIEDGSFLRVKNVTLAYNVNLNSNWLTKARVYVSANNLFTFTDYSGYDPEVNIFGQNPLVRNVDLYGYPVARTIITGVNLTF
ncbi:MAG: TonB-dependent receptor [Bacteroidota bacterium]